jgi:hypothetical protein
LTSGYQAKAKLESAKSTPAATPHPRTRVSMLTCRQTSSPRTMQKIADSSRAPYHEYPRSFIHAP